MSAAPDDIRTYRLDPAAFESTTKRRLYKSFALITALAVPVGWFALTRQSNAEPSSVNDTIPILCSAAGGLAFLGLIMFRTMRTQLKQGKPAWDSLQLTISPNVLRRASVNVPAVEILRSEATKIVAHANGLTVSTEDRFRYIWVPKELIGFSELSERLATWRTIEAPPRARNRLVTIAWFVLIFGSMIATWAIADLRWSMTAASLLFAVSAYNIVQTLKLKTVDNRYKAAAIRVFALLMVTPFARLALYFVTTRLMPR